MTDPAPILTYADDGVALALFHAVPERPRSAPPVLLVHGLFGDRTFFYGTGERGLARELARRGWDAWVAELRGPGRSGAQGRGRAWDFEDWIRRDAPALVRGVLSATGQDRLVWLGHSGGGIIGVAFLGIGGDLGRRVAGLVMASAPAPTRMGVRLGPLRYPVTAASIGLTRLLGRFPARALGVGPADEYSGVVTQLMGWSLAGRWKGTDGTDYDASARRADIPVLALAGAGDRFIAPPEACQTLLGAVGGAEKTFVVCGRAHGFAEDYDHIPLLASIGARREVWPLIAGWLEQRFG